MTDISNRDDTIDVRNIIARVEELEDRFTEGEDDGLLDPLSHEELSEVKALQGLLEDLKGQGGDEQWRGDWYPITMIRDSHFKDYAEELAEDCGMIQAGATWPNNCIDWDEAARQLKQDYTTVEFDGITYWVR